MTTWAYIDIDIRS